MSEPVLVQACRVADFNATTQTCAAPFWTYAPTSIPTLSIADAQQIGMAIAYLLAVAFVCRIARKALNQIG